MAERKGKGGGGGGGGCRPATEVRGLSSQVNVMVYKIIWEV